MGKWILIGGIVLAIWYIEPIRTLTNMIWSNNAAPWEKVEAIYNPVEGSRLTYNRVIGLASVHERRMWALQVAATNNDPRLERTEYECGVGESDFEYAGVTVYRLTVQ